MNMMINYSINDEKLGTVNAGTFTSNAYPREVYECLGFKCDYHFLKKDEFFLNGKVYSEEEANTIIKDMGYTVVRTRENVYNVRHEGKEFIVFT